MGKGHLCICLSFLYVCMYIYIYNYIHPSICVAKSYLLAFDFLLKLSPEARGTGSHSATRGAVCLKNQRRTARCDALVLQIPCGKLPQDPKNNSKIQSHFSPTFLGVWSCRDGLIIIVPKKNGHVPRSE